MPHVAGVPIMGLRPFRLVCSARVRDWENDYRIEVALTIYAADEKGAMFRALIRLREMHAEIPYHSWNTSIELEPPPFTGDTI